MINVLSFIGLIVSVIVIAVYIAACVFISRAASEKGHTVSAVNCFFFGIAYMVYVMSLPDLKKRNGIACEPSYSAVSGKFNKNAVAAVAAAAVVIVGGYFGIQMFEEYSEEKTIELVETEYVQAFNDVKGSIMLSQSCREAKINSMNCTVTLVKKREISNEYIATLTVRCSSSATYGYGYLGQLSKELDHILVAYEILSQIPSDITLSNGKSATLRDSAFEEQLYVYIDGDLVYYPGFRYTG